MSDLETALIAAVCILVCAACLFRMSSKSSNDPSSNDLGQPLLPGGVWGGEAHDTIRAHLAVPAAPPANLRQWGIASAARRQSTFRMSSVTRATCMGGPPVASNVKYTPDDGAITFVNVRAIDYSNPLVQVVWMPLFDRSLIEPNAERRELEGSQRTLDAPPTRMVWWVRRDRYKLRSDDMEVAELLLSSPHTLAEISRLPFEFKNKWLRNELDQRTTNGLVNMTVSRGPDPALAAAAICDSTKKAFRQLLEECPDALSVLARKFQFAIHGETEFFQDVGGVTREVYAKTFETFFSPERGMFRLCDDGVTYEIEPKWSEESMDDFYFIGLLMGKLMLDGLLCTAHLSLVLRKRLLNAPIKFQDLQDVDPALFNSLDWMLKNPIEDVIEEVFSVQDCHGHIVDLKPGGSQICVTDENKIEFIQMRVRHTLVDQVAEPTTALREGLCDVVPPKLLSAFSCRELEFLMSGLTEIDVTDWKEHTVYKHCSPDTPQVVWFWNVVEGMSMPERAKLLQFATGSCKLPVEGFQGLKSARGVSRKFQVSLVVTGGKPRLPQAHTCFNTIDIPDYATIEILNNKLRQALEEGAEGFWIAE